MKHMVQAVNEALHQAMEQYDNMVVLGEDVGVDGGVFRVTDGLYEKHEGRVFDTPLAENTIIGSSIGLAMGGMLPVVEIQFSGFLYPAMQQLVSHASRIRTRTRGTMTCPLVIRTPYGGGVRALEHHSESMEALYAHVPGLKVVIPSTPYDAKGLLLAAIKDPDPVLFMEPKRAYRSTKQKIPEEPYLLPLGRARVEQNGDELTLISWGAMMKECRSIVRDSDHAIELIDVRTISPFDTDTILTSVKKTGKAIIVHEAPRSFGPGAEIIARIAECVPDATVRRVTGYDVVFPLYQLEQDYLPSEERIQQAITEVLQ